MDVWMGWRIGERKGRANVSTLLNRCGQNYNRSVNDTKRSNIIFFKSYGMAWDGMGYLSASGVCSSHHITTNHITPHHITSLRLTGNIDSNQGPFWPHIELSLFCRHSECRNAHTHTNTPNRKVKHKGAIVNKDSYRTDIQRDNRMNIQTDLGTDT